MSLSEQPAEWVTPYAGFRYRNETVCVDEAEQHRRLSACGLDGSEFAGKVDPSLFISLAIHAGIAFIPCAPLSESPACSTGRSNRLAASTIA